MDPLQWLREDIAEVKKELAEMRLDIKDLNKWKWSQIGRHGVISFVVALITTLVVAYIESGR